jgi:hypothetical protein
VPGEKRTGRERLPAGFSTAASLREVAVCWDLEEVEGAAEWDWKDLEASAASSQPLDPAQVL